MDASKPFSRYCVYTILHTEKLENVLAQDGSGKFTENKPWISGSRFVLEAKDKGERVPIIFGAAEADAPKGLAYHAILEEVENDEAKSTATYKFSGLKKVVGDIPLSSLKLKSTNAPLSNEYIRPYAICYTPSFLEE